MLQPVLDAFSRTRFARELLERLPGAGVTLRLGGLPGSSPAVVAAWLRGERPTQLIVIVANTPSEAERWVADLGQLTGGGVALYPQREALGEEEHHVEIAGERTETLQALIAGALGILVTTARASAERTAIPAALAAYRLELARGAALSLRAVIEQLGSMGYSRVPTVTEVAQFSVRGGIIDLYGFGMATPVRAEWWGDVIESVRGFDLTSQRSGEEQEAVTVLPVRTVAAAVSADRGASVRRSLLDLLPTGTLVLVDSSTSNAEEVARAWREAEHHLEVARRLGEDPPARAEILLSPEQWGAALHRFAHLTLCEEPVDLQAGFFPPEKIDRDVKRLRSLLDGGLATLILCDNEGQLERLSELLDEHGRPGGAMLAVGALDGGFVMPALRVMTDHEVFRRARRLRRVRRYRQAAPTVVAGTLASGDYVVHLDHGIGIYRGITSIEVEGGAIEVAIVEYEGGDRLHVPLYRLDQIERYRSGSDDGDQPPPRIHRLGSGSWKKVRDKTREAIQQMAAELLELYARRQVNAGFASPPDTKWQRELESGFLYEDTPDQRRATDEVKKDMERPVPMDRLVVGDVGYGKTEIAVRAAFKAVQGGKQVAVLVPTTVLAEQHGRTFAERLADFPVKVEVLSRFRTAKEQKKALGELAAGTIDIVVGTHRLLSKDVEFKDLGLLVIDEEHRFGVKHKEMIKAIKLAVDVLTLTATPIPRTLHMSLAGIRDLSLIETAPRDRSPILTFVEPWDDGLLEEAFARELDRGGQVFMVHNRIETIETIAARVRALAPRARVAVGHGQMSADDLEAVMQKFVVGDLDILVSTMIVESGLDVPNANTMVVHDAHRFGLAQLYQLRGRVGRSHRRAYCYLLTPDLIDQEAEERLKVLEHHTELGAGYRIALKDLEIRGAGNLLGSEQSGHAHAVGFDLYLRWLEETVKSLRAGGGIVETPVPPDVVFDRPAQLPDEYVADDDSKLDIYRRLARAARPDEIDELRQELRERFGVLPDAAENLLDLTRLRVIGAGLGIQHILVRGDEARVSFRAGTTPRMARLTAALEHVQLAADIRRTVPLSLRLVRLGGEQIIPALVRALRQVGADK
ncbi:MAG: transcription-repair coupling factor [Gemmatimonadetes bacterium]|nr:transcription-repair coupling factor [Gemmatimonadota bacterium]